MPMRVEHGAGHYIHKALKISLAIVASISFCYTAYIYWETEQEKARPRLRALPMPDFDLHPKAPAFQVRIDAGTQTPRQSSEARGSIWSDLARAAAAGAQPRGETGQPTLRRHFIGDGDGRSAADWAFSLIGTLPPGLNAGTSSQRTAESVNEQPAPRTTGFSTELRRAPGFGARTNDGGSQPGLTPVETTPVKPSGDDVEFAQAALRAAEGNVRHLKRAQAVMAEFARRYPRSSETEALQAQMKHVVSRNTEALAERSNLHADTPVAPVQFEPGPLAELNECLVGIKNLDKLAAVTRPVSASKDTPAFLVLGTLSMRGVGAQDVSALRVIREQALAQIAPCLQSLLQKGTVSIQVVHGQSTSSTGKRIESVTGAVLFDRSSLAVRGKS